MNFLPSHRHCEAHKGRGNPTASEAVAASSRMRSDGDVAVYAFARMRDGSSAVAVLSIEEVESVMRQPDTGETMGLRDRAMLETLYSTGMRRMEMSMCPPRIMAKESA